MRFKLVESTSDLNISKQDIEDKIEELRANSYPEIETDENTGRDYFPVGAAESILADIIVEIEGKINNAAFHREFLKAAPLEKYEYERDDITYMRKGILKERFTDFAFDFISSYCTGISTSEPTYVTATLDMFESMKLKEFLTPILEENESYRIEYWFNEDSNNYSIVVLNKNDEEVKQVQVDNKMDLGVELNYLKNDYQISDVQEIN